MLQGVDVICHSTNLVLEYCQRASFARAIENRMFIIVANRTGSEKLGNYSLDFTGNSIFYSCKAEILAQSDAENTDLQIVEFDPVEARNKNITERNNLINDRRREMYKL
jgi:predicted amidohydrolase